MSTLFNGARARRRALICGSATAMLLALGVDDAGKRRRAGPGKVTVDIRKGLVHAAASVAAILVGASVLSPAAWATTYTNGDDAGIAAGSLTTNGTDPNAGGGSAGDGVEITGATTVSSSALQIDNSNNAPTANGLNVTGLGAGTLSVTLTGGANISGENTGDAGLAISNAGGTTVVEIGDNGTVAGGFSGYGIRLDTIGEVQIDSGGGGYGVYLGGGGKVTVQSSAVVFGGANAFYFNAGGSELDYDLGASEAGGATAVGSNNLYKATGGAGTIALGFSGFDKFEDASTGGTVKFSSSDFAGAAMTIDTGAVLSATTAQLGTGVTNSGALQLTGDGAGSGYAGAISGSGAVTAASGVSTLKASDSYTGLTTIDAGATLKLTGAGSIAASGDPLVDGTFDISGASAGVSVVSLSGSGQVLLGANTLTLTDAADTFSGVISGSGGLTIGGGNEILTGTNDLTGTTTIDSGATLQLGDGTAGHNGSVVGLIIDSGALKFAVGGSQTFAGLLGGGGSIEIGSGTLIVAGFESTVGGDTTIDAGATLRWGDGTQQGVLAHSDIGGDLSVVDNGAFVFDFGGGGLAGAISISGSGSVEIATGSLGVSVANTYTGATTIDPGAHFGLDDSGTIAASSGVIDNGDFSIAAVTSSAASIKSLSGSGTVDLGSKTLILTAAGGTFSGDIAGSGGLTLSGGTETLTGTNTFTGGATIDSGTTLQLGDGTSGHNGSVGGAISDNGLLKFDYSGSQDFSNTLTGAGSVEVAGGTLVARSISFVSNTVTIDSGATLQWGDGSVLGYVAAPSLVDNGSLVIDLAPLQVIQLNSVVISGSGAVRVESGELQSGAVNTYTGQTTIDSGARLVLTGSGTISDSSGVADNGTFDVSGTTAGASITTLSGSGKVVLGTQSLVLTSAHDTFSGVISGSGGLDIQSGAESLSGINTYTSQTNVGFSAILSLTGAGSIAQSSRVEVDGTFDISGATSGASIKSLLGAGAVALGGKTLTLTAASDTFAGVISGAGGLNLTGGTETLTGTNTYRGQTVVAPGATLALSGLGSISQSSLVTVNGTLDLTGFVSHIDAAVAVTDDIYGPFDGAVPHGATGKGDVLFWQSAGFDIDATIGFTDASGTIIDVIHTDHDGYILSGPASGGADIGDHCVPGADTRCVVATGKQQNLEPIIASLNGGEGICCGTSSLFVTIGAISFPVIQSLAGSGSVLLGDNMLEIANGHSIFSGDISGAGGLDVTGGTQGLSGVNDYAGETKVEHGAGLVLLGSGSIETSAKVEDDGVFDISGTTFGARIVSLAGDGEVQVGGLGLILTDAADTFSGDIEGTGAFVVNGGTETLTGVSGLSGSVDVEAGATLKLAGAGSVANASVFDQGVFDVSAADLGGVIKSRPQGPDGRCGA